MARGFPWRQNRCWCRKLATNYYNGEDYCYMHYVQEIKKDAQELNGRLYDIVGKEKRDALIDEWFPTEESFNWVECFNRLKTTLDQLDIPTGLISLNP